MCSSDPQIKLGDEANKIMAAFTANYPGMAKAIQGQAVPFASSDLASQQAEFPGEQKLGIDTASSNISGAGGKLAGQASELDKAINPEFYKTQSETSNGLADLFKSINLSGALSGGEQSSIERGVNRSNINSGISTPTPTSTISSAMLYGDASNQRKLQQQGVATGAVGAAAGAMPTLRSPIDPFSIATGAATSPSASSGLGTAAGLGSGVQGSLSGLAGNAMDANVSRRSGFEKFMGAMPSYSG